MGQLFFAGDGSPLSRPEDVIRFLGKQEEHWKERYSAYEAAHSWFDAQDLPPAIRALLQTDPVYDSAKLQRAYFERQTLLDQTGRGPSQTDVLAMLQIKTGVAVLGVEAKVNESFGQLVSGWNTYSPSKLRRLAGLIERLEIDCKTVSLLRYQLFHRTVATLLEAEAAGAREAVMLVQSFSPDNLRAGFNDFQSFAAAIGTPVTEPGRLSPPVQRRNVRLRMGWTINSMRADAVA